MPYRPPLPARQLCFHGIDADTFSKYLISTAAEGQVLPPSQMCETFTLVNPKARIALYTIVYNIEVQLQYIF